MTLIMSTEAQKHNTVNLPGSSAAPQIHTERAAVDFDLSLAAVIDDGNISIVPSSQVVWEGCIVSRIKSRDPRGQKEDHYVSDFGDYMICTCSAYRDYSCPHRMMVASRKAVAAAAGPGAKLAEQVLILKILSIAAVSSQ